MKKVASFGAALVLFLAIILIMNFAVGGIAKGTHKDLGTWVSSYKDLSHKAVAQNINNDTMMVFGSSEFTRGKSTIYHPANLFKEQSVDLMLIGNAFNQCLEHAIKLGSVEDQIKNKKVVLILSPTWFYESGVTKQVFPLRFSESDYMALMENDRIPMNIKEYIGDRCQDLLSQDAKKEKAVLKHNKMFLMGKSNAQERFFYKIKKTFLDAKEMFAVNMSICLSSIVKPKIKNLNMVSGNLDWTRLEKEAKFTSGNAKHNKYYMKDKYYKSKFKITEKKAAGSLSKQSFAKSPEYDDLKCFLDICKASGIKVELIIQPINGYWYDHVGLTKAKRQNFRNNINRIGNEYGCEIADLSEYEYSKDYFQDALHPDSEGWVKINEKINGFYNEN